MKWFETYAEWEAECKKREGFEGPYSLYGRPKYSYQFITKGGGTAAMWNGEACKGSIFSDEVKL